jgi:nicotinate-nucleotide adenylyltransferase
MQRPGESRPELYPERMADTAEELRSSPAGRIYPQPVTQLQISATGIRELIGAGQSPRYLLPEAVLTIIREERLYRRRGK